MQFFIIVNNKDWLEGISDLSCYMVRAVTIHLVPIFFKVA